MVEIFVHNGLLTDTTTLAAKTALLHTTLAGSLVKNFMGKNIRTEFSIISFDVADKMLLVLAPSDATVSQVAAGLADTSLNPEDSVNYRTGQKNVRQVWDFFIAPVSEAATSLNQFTHQWKIPPNGIPQLRGGGLSIFAYNMDQVNDYVNGPVLHSITKSMGGWF